MSKKLAIAVGDKTTHNGEVLTGSDNMKINNRAIARVGDKVHCPDHGETHITEGSSFHSNSGKAIAYDGCKTSCGAELKAGLQSFYYINDASNDVYYLAFIITSAVRQIPRSSGKKITLICRTSLIFISLGLINNAFADDLYEKITATHDSVERYLSPAKAGEIAIYPTAWKSENGTTAAYVNFQTKTAYNLVNWTEMYGAKWLSDDIAIIYIQCGAGCERRLIFIAPQTVVECPPSSTDKNGFSTTAPLAIDVKQGLYACYDYAGNIQINRLPHVIKVITPPPDATVKQAKFIESDLVVTYQSIPGQN